LDDTADTFDFAHGRTAVEVVVGVIALLPGLVSSGRGTLIGIEGTSAFIVAIGKGRASDSLGCEEGNDGDDRSVEREFHR
jgi:hypothetical protein